MGSVESRPVGPASKNLIDVIIAEPQVLDELDFRSMTALAQTCRDARQVVDQPCTWKNVFSKEIGVSPNDLPLPPRHLQSPSRDQTRIRGRQCRRNAPTVPPFKLMARGLTITQYIAENPDKNVKLDALDQVLLNSIDDYLDTHLPTLASNLDKRTLAAQTHNAEIGQIKWDIAGNVVGTTMLGAQLGLLGYMLPQVGLAVDSLASAKVAALVTVLGVKGAKIFLYTIFGVSGAIMTAGFAYFGYLTVDSIRELRREHAEHKVRLRSMRVQAQIDAGRQIALARGGQQ